MFSWLFGEYKKRVQIRQSDRSERNAVIRRIVTAAAHTTPKTTTAQPNGDAGDVVGPFTVNTAAVSPTDSGGIPRDKVAERAYEIWIQNGRPTGTAERDWQQALRELTAETSTPPVAATA